MVWIVAHIDWNDLDCSSHWLELIGLKLTLIGIIWVEAHIDWNYLDWSSHWLELFGLKLTLIGIIWVETRMRVPNPLCLEPAWVYFEYINVLSALTPNSVIGDYYSPIHCAVNIIIIASKIFNLIFILIDLLDFIFHHESA